MDGGLRWLPDKVVKREGTSGWQMIDFATVYKDKYAKYFALEFYNESSLLPDLPFVQHDKALPCWIIPRLVSIDSLHVSLLWVKQKLHTHAMSFAHGSAVSAGLIISEHLITWANTYMTEQTDVLMDRLCPAVQDCASSAQGTHLDLTLGWQQLSSGTDVRGHVSAFLMYWDSATSIAAWREEVKIR